jgi:IS5 family transposase
MGKREKRLYQRHRWRVEGVHGEAKTWHGLARAIRRGLDNMRIQAFLTAAAINLKRLAAAIPAAIAGFSPEPLAKIRAGAHARPYPA